MVEFGDRRSAAPQDFDDSALAFLKEMATEIEQADFRARVGDLLWVIRRDHEMASIAVSAYLEAAMQLEDPDKWPPAIERIERAAQIAVALGRTSEQAESVRNLAKSLLKKYSGNDPLFMSARLIEILLEIGGEDPERMAEIADHAANNAKQQTNWHRAHTYLIIAATCRKKAGVPDRARDSFIKAAETLVEQAEYAAGLDDFLGASVHLQKAIEALRKESGTKSRVDQLHAILLEYQRDSVKKMQPISVAIDNKELTSRVVQQVKGLDWEQAFVTMAHLTPIPLWQEVHDRAVNSVQNNPLQHLFMNMRVNANGKVVARSPGGIPSNEQGLEVAVLQAMFEHTTLRHHVIAASVIEPVRRIIFKEHDTSIDSVLPLLSRSSFIPSDRRVTFARGLVAGFSGDYLLSAYILIPQLEHCIRVAAAAKGNIVSTLDCYGIQTERDLNHLLYQDYMSDIFPPGVVFDLRCLLVDPNGENFRNLLAHGLLSDAAAESPVSAYVWWMALHLVVGFWTPEKQ
jgi:tetratricopeptide (TPR) repeat protein